MSIKLNSKGFSAVEALLILVIVAMVGGVGYFVLHAQSKSTDNLNQASSESQSAVVDKNKKAQDAEKALIVTAVKAYGPAASTINVKSIIGDNSEGSFSSGNVTTTFIAHKDKGQWSVVFEGSQMPGKAVGTKYGLPKSWYSASY